MQEAANDKLKVKINDLSNAIDDDYDICFELATTSTSTEAAQKDLAVFQKQLAEDDLLTANLMLIDNTT